MGRRFESGLRHHPFLAQGATMTRVWTILLLFLCAAPLWGQERVLKPFDRIRLSSRADHRLNTTCSVNEDGTLWLPGGTSISVAGFTVERARPGIAWQLARSGFDIAGLLLVFDGRMQNSIAFDGAVLAAGESTHRPGMKLADVVLLASPTVAADLDRIEITDTQGKRTVHRFVSFLQSGGDWNVPIHPGDHIHFPLLQKASEIAVLGEVRQPGPVDYFAGITVRQAIGFANGLTGNAVSTAVEVVRDDKVIDTLNLDLGYDRELQRGDIVRVRKKASEQFVFVVGAVKRPGSFDFRPGMRLLEALDLAEGPDASADLNQVFLVRRVDGNRKRMKQNLDRISKRLDPNPILAPGDTIEVLPKKSGRTGGR